MHVLKKVMQATAWIGGILAGFLILAIAFLELLIGWGVEHQSRKAMARFAGDRVDALIAHVECQSCDLRDRNSAVWALGQLRDRRALPVLYNYRTGRPCNHLRTICQHEISKAIRWIEGDAYMAPQLWRVMLRADPPRSAKPHA